ncbi:autophagy-related protein 18b isoform X2 [Amborella trichopoda]|uniref:autophagy-related protein 18b isoform X2 n=1 Tax=Amborella trichopoda TaxID=13333 RepID=UPI0009C0D2CA|nr:autophagy-related protein 18b isoform X2 [Amborella trichopoda]|eukprot:XP_020523738.1 autophagy-related protein 18b isoform X2 [Amborella trichopoda]
MTTIYVNGAYGIVEMLYSTNFLAIVGAGEQPSLSPRRLCLFNTVTECALKELNFLTTILAVRVNRKRLIIVLQDRTYIYDSNSLALLDTIETVANTKGLCAFSPSLDGCYIALPANTTKGSALVYNAMNLHSHCQIEAHRSPLAAMALSSDGVYIATASEQGTIIRVHLISQAKKSYSFRRGTYPSTIYSLAFGPPKGFPHLLVATSSSGSLHVFHLDSVTNQRNKKSVGLLASVLPNTINGALEPSHHYVFPNVLPTGVKSCATIHTIERIASASLSRASIHVITYDGYFREYRLIIDDSHDSSWVLEHEFNMLTRPS